MPEEVVSGRSQTVWDGLKYKFVFEKGVRQFRPFTQAGDVLLNGQIQDRLFYLNLGDQVEFHPLTRKGRLTWDLKVRFGGLSVTAKVYHEQAGHYILPSEFSVGEDFNLVDHVQWEDFPSIEEYWDESKLKNDLDQLNVIYGRRPGVWDEFLAVQGMGEVIVAESTLPVPPEHSRLIDFVGDLQPFTESEDSKIDYFASKVKLIEKGAVLARKIPGKPGISGKNVFGKDIAAAPFKDFQFRLKKNVFLSEDGLEVIAACAGQPIRLDDRTYMVENVYVLHKDCDLATGSIEFPGDVFINGNVQDGLRIHAGGKIEIRGSVSHAEIRAEKGAVIHQNLIGGKTVIGEKFVARSELLRSLSEFQERLSECLSLTEGLMSDPKAANLQPGQILKLLLERQFTDLPKLSLGLEKFIANHKDNVITEGLILSVRTAKHFLGGLGPLDKQAFPLLQRVAKALRHFVENLSLEIPEKLSFTVSYVQGAVIQCGGVFECQKGVYNSEIRVEGDVSIGSVCRGGKIFTQGNVQIRELGGSEISSTFVQISPSSRLLVDYCHPNVVIAVGKEIIRIEEPYKNLHVYREKGITQVEKVRVNPL